MLWIFNLKIKILNQKSTNSKKNFKGGRVWTPSLELVDFIHFCYESILFDLNKIAGVLNKCRNENLMHKHKQYFLSTSVKTTAAGKKAIIHKSIHIEHYIIDSGAEYLYLSHNKILHIPDFTQITCQLNYPNDALLFGVAGLVKNGGEDRLMVCEDGCHLLKENEWELTNPSFRRCYLYK